MFQRRYTGIILRAKIGYFSEDSEDNNPLNHYLVKLMNS